MGVRRAATAVLAGPLLVGCSIAFVKAPPSEGYDRIEDVDCTAYNGAPGLDTTLAVALTSLSIFALAASEEERPTAAFAIFTGPPAVFFGISAAGGFMSTAKCRAATERVRRLHYPREYEQRRADTTARSGVLVFSTQRDLGPPLKIVGSPRHNAEQLAVWLEAPRTHGTKPNECRLNLDAGGRTLTGTELESTIADSVRFVGARVPYSALRQLADAEESSVSACDARLVLDTATRHRLGSFLKAFARQRDLLGGGANSAGDEPPDPPSSDPPDGAP